MKKNIHVFIFAFLAFIIPTFPGYAQTGPNIANDLFQEGYILYQQRYSPNAFSKFKEAAKLGHVEAAYYAGNILRRNFTFITEEAEDFYRQAADGGDIYAMLRFAQNGNFCGTFRECNYDRKKWLNRAEEEALDRVELGDTNAMMALFSISWMSGNKADAFNWALEAAEAGNATAQHWLAVGLLSEREMGFYWTDEARQKDILKWLQASAEQGFPPSMLELAITLRKRGDLKQARYWVEQMAHTDFYDALLEAGTQIMMGPHIADIYLPSISYDFREPRPVQGAALLMAIHRQTGKNEPMEVIDLYREHLTQAILQEAEVLSNKLLINTSVIYYLPKFGI